MKLSKRDTRILIIGAVVMILIIIVNYVIIPFIESEGDIRKKTEQKEMMLQKYEKIISQKDEIEKKLAQVRGKQLQLDKKLLKGSTSSLAAAEMQKLVEQFSKAHELELKSVKVKDAEERGGFLAIPLEIRLITDLSTTKKFLTDLEKSTKYLTIPQLKISVKNQRDPKEVIVTMVVTGFFLQEGTVKEEKV